LGHHALFDLVLQFGPLLLVGSFVLEFVGARSPFCGVVSVDGRRSGSVGSRLSIMGGISSRRRAAIAMVIGGVGIHFVSFEESYYWIWLSVLGADKFNLKMSILFM
jgi:hypothetical protein